MTTKSIKTRLAQIKKELKIVGHDETDIDYITLISEESFLIKKLRNGKP